MNPITLPTSTPEQREIVKAIDELRSICECAIRRVPSEEDKEKLEEMLGETLSRFTLPESNSSASPTGCDCKGLGYFQDDGSWRCSACGKLKTKDEVEQLRSPDSPSVSTEASPSDLSGYGSSDPKEEGISEGLSGSPSSCTHCGFDAEGWRYFTTAQERIYPEDIYLGGDRDVHADYKTRRHKADCPTLKSEPKSWQENMEQVRSRATESEGKREYDVFMEIAKDAQRKEICERELAAKLREETNCSMRDCVRAVRESGGDHNKSLDFLRNIGKPQPAEENPCKCKSLGECNCELPSKIPVEPFSLEEEMLALRSSHAWNPIIDSIISKIVERINSMEQTNK